MRNDHQLADNAHNILTMTDRSRSRSPDRGAPPADQDQYPASDNNPPQNGGDAQGQDGSMGNGAGGDDQNGEEVKLYVGNLDYGKSRTGVYVWNGTRANDDF